MKIEKIFNRILKKKFSKMRINFKAKKIIIMITRIYKYIIRNKQKLIWHELRSSFFSNSHLKAAKL
jgi:hypothetical protein